MKSKSNILKHKIKIMKSDSGELPPAVAEKAANRKHSSLIDFIPQILVTTFFQCFRIFLSNSTCALFDPHLSVS